jgi:tetratricopeptide (TPR) repeat protein
MYKQTLSKPKAVKFEAKFTDACSEAKRFEDAGQYENATIALGELWLGIGVKPTLDNFPNSAKADVLVRIGSLTGWLGSSGQIDGSQEMAKDLIGEGLRIYDEVNDIEKIAEAQSDLGLCYWREGAFNEAETYFKDSLELVPIDSHALRGKILLTLVNTAISNRKYDVAISLLDQAESAIKPHGDDLLQGKLYFHKALVFKLLFEEDGQPELAEKSANYYFEASQKYRKANHQRYEAIVENNLGYLFLIVNNFKNAHEHLDNAINLFSVFGDSGRLASVFDTKARVYLAEKKFIEAELFAQKSVQLFTRGDEYYSLSESLTTLGTIFARQDSFANAKESFEKAIQAAEFVNDSINLGLAMLSQIEELHQVLSNEERKKLFARCVELLSGSNQNSIQNRLKNAEAICMSTESHSKWDDFSLPEKVLEFEAKFILEALGETGGAVTKAAKLLGLSHQNLSLLLKTRHKELASAKKPRRKRSDRKRKARRPKK